jgi:hypothetical protein
MPLSEGWRQPASGDPLFAYESHAHESACGMGFKLEQHANLLGGHLAYHWFRLNIEQ